VVRELKDWSWGRWHALPVLTQDAALAALLAALTFVPALAGSGTGLVRLPAEPVDLTVVVLALGQCLPLVARRRAPALCLALVGVSFALFQLRGSGAVYSGMGLIVALYSAGAYQQRARALLAGAASAGFVVMVVAVHTTGSVESVADDVTFYLASVACWVVGRWVQARRAQEAAHRDAERAAAAADERARIARELHDVVTHHVTAMVVQADAAAYLTDRPERVTAVLGDIAGTGRQALVELRHQLGVLRVPADGSAGRMPALEPLADVVERVRASGQPVHLVQRAELVDLPGPTALAVHRVVQESLTNALKHAPARCTTVTVVRTGTGAGAVVDVEVTTAGSPAGRPAAPSALVDAGSGRGLAGLAERVGVLGGRLEAGPRPGGGFGVRARIPVGAP